MKIHRIFYLILAFTALAALAALAASLVSLPALKNNNATLYVPFCVGLAALGNVVCIFCIERKAINKRLMLRDAVSYARGIATEIVAAEEPNTSARFISAEKAMLVLLLFGTKSTIDHPADYTSPKNILASRQAAINQLRTVISKPDFDIHAFIVSHEFEDEALIKEELEIVRGHSSNWVGNVFYGVQTLIEQFIQK